jgi:hypothetical protein
MRTQVGRRVALAFVIGIAATACAANGAAVRSNAAQTGSPPVGVEPTASLLPPASPTDRWLEFFQHTPYPFSTPLPLPASSPLDGAYAKVEPKVGTPVPCRRCPDYAPEGGLWKLNFSDGIYRVLHVATGWRSLGSFTVDGDRLIVFNDPNCSSVTRRYAWRLSAGALILEAMEDECAIGLRAANLSARPWSACQPPNIEAAITDHWLRPAGC